MIDFTNCERNRFRAYGGATGNKINIHYQGKSYMLKFPPQARRGGEMSYTNGCVSEYLGCHIFASLGFKVQETLLGTYTDNKNKEKACGGLRGFHRRRKAADRIRKTQEHLYRQ